MFRLGNMKQTQGGVLANPSSPDAEPTWRPRGPSMYARTAVRQTDSNSGTC